MLGVQPKQSTTEQFNNLIGFRQAIYEQGLDGYRDSQFELMDALLANIGVQSYVELTLSPLFRRGWSSGYAAVEDGRQNTEQLREVFCQQVPATGVQVFPLDTTVWPHPSARTLAGLVYEHSPTKVKGKHTAVKGHVYSLLGWAPERGGSWALPIESCRLEPDETAVELGIAQVQALCEQRAILHGDESLDVIVADGKYGNHRFFGPLQDLPCAKVARLRRDRVLYGPPPSYAGRGRPRIHGRRFAFKEQGTWSEPVEDVTFSDARWGQVHLRAWPGLHAKQDADTEFDVLLAEVHLERDKRPEPIWLGYQGADGYAVRDVWSWFDQRWSIEPAIRFRKQKLHWTLPMLQHSDRCDVWTRLVDIAYWQLFLARHLVIDRPLPWQKPQAQLTPGRVLQAMALLFPLIGTPTRSVKVRGKPRGWPTGRKRSPPTRFKTVKRGRKAMKTS
jgi:hypothetical protein